MAPSSSVRRLGLILVSFALAFSGTFARPASAASLAQAREITLLAGTVELDPALAQAVTAGLAESGLVPAEVAFFAATDMRPADGWALLSIVGLTDLGADQSWHAEDGSWFGLILARESDPGIWEIGVQGSDVYFALLAQVPASVLDAGEAAALDDGFEMLAAAAPNIFPWESGTAMIYGPLGLHAGGSGWKAVDMATDGNTSLGHAPGIAVAAQPGTIDYICKDGITVTIRMGGFLYAHLLNNSGLYAGRHFAQGEQLGQLKSGTFNAACGYGYQPSNWVHLHWAFPNADLQVESWTLSMSTGLWTKGSATAAPGQDWIFARPGGGLDCSQLSSAGVTLYENLNCNKAVAGASAAFTAGVEASNLSASIADKASSIYISPGWSALLYADSPAPNSGSWRCINRSAADLSLTNYEHGNVSLAMVDSVSAVSIYPSSDCNGAGPAASTVGLAADGWFFLRSFNAAGGADMMFPYGWSGPAALMGDWDGDGTATPGISDRGWYFLRNSNSSGVADLVLQYGWPSATPVVGDWDGDGDATIGIYSNGWFFLRNSNTPGSADIVFSFGGEQATPILGDWDGNGTVTAGVYSGGWFYLRNTNTSGPADLTFSFGPAGASPVAGDWDGDGIDTIGIFNGGRFFLRNTNTSGSADRAFPFGWAGPQPLAGNWGVSG